MFQRELERLYSKRKVLVVGGAGFIGSHVVTALVALGAQVTVLDNLSIGSLQNLRPVITQVKFFYADVTSASGLLRGTMGQDMVFHCVEQKNRANLMEDPEHYDVQETLNMLQACRRNRVAQVVFMSLIDAYENKSLLSTNFSSVVERSYKEFAELYEIKMSWLRYDHTFVSQKTDSDNVVSQKMEEALIMPLTNNSLWRVHNIVGNVQDYQRLLGGFETERSVENLFEPPHY